jgi:dihydroorotase
MKVLIKKARIIDNSSPFHNQEVDVFINDGLVDEIAVNINLEAEHIIEGKKLCLSPGWVDLKADFCDPGFEHKETVISGLDAAAFGGYTHVSVLPSTQPVSDNKANIDYLRRQGEDHVCSVHPIGAVTEGLKGENLAQLFDMYNNGVRLFSDDLTPMSAGILYRALLYAKNFGGRIVAFSKNESMAKNAQVNEGLASVNTGLKGYPDVAEWIEIERNLQLLEYTGGKLHLSGISSAKSVDLIKAAKKKGLDLTADVHVSNLLFTENEVFDFDTNFKFLPCLRTKEDQSALWKGLKDGTLDTIVSDHRPNDTEEKDLEFDMASFGSLQLQTVFSALMTHPEASVDLICEKLGQSARKIIELEAAVVNKGSRADFTVFSEDSKWIFNKEDICSEVKNSSFIGHQFKHKVIAVINGGKTTIL